MMHGEAICSPAGNAVRQDQAVVCSQASTSSASLLPRRYVRKTSRLMPGIYISVRLSHSGISDPVHRVQQAGSRAGAYFIPGQAHAFGFVGVSSGVSTRNKVVIVRLNCSETRNFPSTNPSNPLLANRITLHSRALWRKLPRRVSIPRRRGPRPCARAGGGSPPAPGDRRGCARTDSVAAFRC